MSNRGRISFFFMLVNLVVMDTAGIAAIELDASILHLKKAPPRIPIYRPESTFVMVKLSCCNGNDYVTISLS